MTEEEIRRDHRLAKSPHSQIQILADINGVTPKIIRRILSGQGWEEARERRHPRPQYIPTGAVKKWTYNDIELFKKLRREKYRLKEIAEIMGITYRSAQGAARRFKDTEEVK